MLQREVAEEPSSPRESEVSMPQSPAASTRDSLLDGKVGGRGSAVQLERLRDALRQKEAHAISLRDQLTSMEATRDRYPKSLQALRNQALPLAWPCFLLGIMGIGLHPAHIWSSCGVHGTASGTCHIHVPRADYHKNHIR